VVEVEEMPKPMELSVFKRASVFQFSLRVEMAVTGNFLVATKLSDIEVTIGQRNLVFSFFCLFFIL
jgi:hypothetical protein